MRRSRLFSLALALLVLVGCSTPDKPPAGLPDAKDTVAAIATALTELDATKAPIKDDPVSATDELHLLTENMAGKPTVTVVGSPRYDANAKTATATLDVSWPYTPKPWQYQTTVDLAYVNGTWMWAFAPKALYPKLTSHSRLEYTRLAAERGRILGAGGVALMEKHTVFEVGLDKARCAPERWEASARSIAALVGVDADGFVKTVKAYGAKAFVPAITLRDAAPATLADIEGGRAIKGQAMLSLEKGFAGPLLGSVGPATKEEAADSHGTIAVGEDIGRGGLSGLHDDTLRGVAGYRVDLIPRDDSPSAPAPPPGEILPAMATKIEPVAGKDLRITLDAGLQQKLERQLAQAPTPTSIVVIQPSTGRILAMASGPTGQTTTTPWVQRDAPGSTFKIVSSLGLLRAGLTPDSPVNCSEYAMVNGQRINNFDGLPTSYNGQIPLRDAVGISCNSAFINSRDKLGGSTLGDAAASLGMAPQKGLGFSPVLADVPTSTSDNELAGQVFGQANISASLLGMTGMAASVSAGKTVVPWLVEGFQPSPVGAPLTAQEASHLRDLMGRVTQIGLPKQSVLIGAKTGTAQFTDRNGQPKAHGWLVGYTANDIAIGVFQQEDADHTYTLAQITKALS